MADSYLNEVPGVKDVRLRAGTVLPRRNVLEIDGAVVTDDPIGSQTKVVLRAPFKIQRVNIADFVGVDDDDFVVENVDADFYRFVGIDSIIGLGVPRMDGRCRVWLANADIFDALVIKHEDLTVPPTTRFRTASGSNISVAVSGGVQLAAYYASRWNIIG